MPTTPEVPLPEGVSPDSFVRLDPDAVREAIDKWFMDPPDLAPDGRSES